VTRADPEAFSPVSGKRPSVSGRSWSASLREADSLNERLLLVDRLLEVLTDKLVLSD